MTDDGYPPVRLPVLAAASWRSNAELIEDVVRLGYIRPDDRVIDLTYGQGIWWKNYDHPGHFTAMFHDAVDPPKKGAARLAERARTHPTAGTVGDFTRLHMPTAAYEVVAFDPPYVCLGGRTTIGEDVAGFVAGYGLRDAPRTPDDMRAFIAQGLAEATRICVPGGILLVKCAPYISSGKLQLGDHWLLEDALALGLKVEERFIHVGHVRPQPGGRRVVHARNNYSVLFVFRTPPARKPSKEPAEPDRGVSYADGGFATTTVHYPDPARVAAIHDEWRTQ